MADASSIMAVKAGVDIVQATMNGYGERCGNASLTTQIGNLSLKLGYETITPDNIRRLKWFSAQFNDIANTYGDPMHPYIGKNAFTHKAGMHIDAVAKSSDTMEHIDPELVGSSRKNIISDISGKKAMFQRVQSIIPAVSSDDPRIIGLLDKIKIKELNGYDFAGADASMDLLILKEFGVFKPHFDLIGFKVLIEEPHDDDVSLATMEVEVKGIREINASHGNGPVNALDAAARKTLERFYPILGEMYLTDFKVRVIDSNKATASEVRVVIESSDGTATWSTVGVSDDIINASWKALTDSIEYKLHCSEEII